MITSRKYFNFFVFLLLAALLAACSRRGVHFDQSVIPPEDIQDIAVFPQNLEVYAQSAGSNRLLLPRARQDELNARFNDIWFGPWQMRRCSISRQDVAAPFRRPSGHRGDGSLWTEDQWAAMRVNVDLPAYAALAIPAITLRQTDLREMPTHEARFAKPTPEPAKDPFDYFQYSLLPPGMPLLIAHTSRDRRWHYVECPVAGGWVDANDVLPVDGNFRRQWLTGEYAALIRDNVALPGTGPAGGDAKAGIGAVLPVTGKDAQGGLKVLAPVREKSGKAGIAGLLLDKRDAVVKPLPLTPGNVAAVGNAMMKQPYGWGGMLGLRDCSAVLRDLFTPFGLWLPRNSRGQARHGSIVSLESLPWREKEEIILDEGVPFLSLVGMPGHITLYVGRWQGKAAIFHNVWGLRIVKDDNDDERFIIGRAVVTSITPGMELVNLYRTKTFADRIATLTTLGR